MDKDDLVITKIFNCSKRELFDAWSKPSIIKKWFFAGSESIRNSTVNLNFVVGGVYNVTMYFEKDSVTHYGVYKEIIHYSRIAFTWNSPVVKETYVTLDFKELSANRTQLKLIHGLLPNKETIDKHNQGWNSCFVNLEKLIIS